MAQESKDNHAGYVTRSLDNFRKHQMYCDVTLVVEGRKFHVHRNILAASSPYFHKLFTSYGTKKKKQQSSFTIQELSVAIMDDLLHYLYTGFVDLKPGNVQSLIKAANMIEITRLKDLGCEFLQNTLSLENCVSIFQFADKNECVSLRSASKEFINENFQHVAKTEKFLGLNEEQIEEYILDDNIVVDREEEIYEALLRWVKHDGKSRSKHFSRLFQHIRLFSVSKYYLHTNVGGEELVKVNRSCIEILLDALKVVSLMPPECMPATPLLTPRKCLQQDAEAVIACGGLYEDETGSSTLCYVISENAWFLLAPIHEGKHCKRWAHGMAECNGFIYVVGGFYDDAKQVFSDATSVVERYRLETDSWSRVEKLKKGTALPGIAVLNGCLFVVGGSDNDALKDLQKYNPVNDAWEILEPLSTGRCAPCVVANQSHVYACGGMQESGEFLDTAERYDAALNTWSPIASLTTGRAFACGVAMENKVFVIGGSTDVMGQNALNTCEVYDIFTGDWSQVASMHVPRFAAGVAVVGERIFVFGGGFAGETFRSVESYSVESNEWRIESDMPRATAHIQCSTVKIPRRLLTSLHRVK